MHSIVKNIFCVIFSVVLSCATVQMPDRAELLDATFVIEGERITLTAGRHAVPAAPGSATMTTTAVFDTPVFGDLDGDGDADAALVLVYDPGGSGTFYYAAAAVNRDGAWHGTNAVLLGDRIEKGGAMIRIEDGIVIAAWLDRNPGEVKTARPTRAKRLTLKLDNGLLRAVENMQ